MSVRVSESILVALLAAIEAAAPVGASVKRNVATPNRIPAAGAIILRDGDPGTPETFLSPITYLYEHVAEVDLLVESPDATRDTAFDTLAQAVGVAVTADRTLGGLCDWVEASAPAPVDLAEEGAETLKAATIAVVLHYATTSPVG